MKKMISLSALAVLVALVASFASFAKKPLMTLYKDANGNIISQATYNGCGNTTQVLCGTEYVNGVAVAHRNTPIP